MVKEAVIVGCEKFEEEAHNVLDAINRATYQWGLLGYVDDDPSGSNVEQVRAHGSKIIETVESLTGFESASFVIGHGAARRSADEQHSKADRPSETLVDLAAAQGFDVQLGLGSVVCAGVRLTNFIQLGRHCHLDLNTTSGPDVVIHDYVTVNSPLTISGWMSIGPESMSGSNSAVLQNRVIGSQSTVGGGSLVTRDVADRTVAKAPAK